MPPPLTYLSSLSRYHTTMPAHMWFLYFTLAQNQLVASTLVIRIYNSFVLWLGVCNRILYNKLGSML